MAAGGWISQRRRLVPVRNGGGQPPRPYFVICGDDPLAHRLVDELVNRYGAEVAVILGSRRRNHGPQLSRMPRVRLVEADRLDAEAFTRAKLGRAQGLALVQQDDVGNLHAALRAQEACPGLRLVIRMFNLSLGYGVRRLIPDCAVLSDALMAAPEFVAAALGEVAPTLVRLPGRTVYVARRVDVHPDDVVCGIARTDTEGGHPEVLPADDRMADLVLAVANPKRTVPPSAPLEEESVTATRRAGRRARSRARRRRPVLALSRTLLSLIDSKLELAVLLLFAVMIGGVIAYAVLDGISPWQALYTTVIVAADAGDPELDGGLARQITQAAVAVAGIAMVPVLTAAVVNAAFNARLATVLGRLRQPIADHLVVIGLGNVGTRVIRHLHELGHDVVAVDRSESARGVQLARELDIPVVIGDGGAAETLRQASIHTCRGLLALSTADVVNLEAALQVRTQRPSARVVLRLFDDDFARRVEQAFDIPISRSVSSLAAPAFAAALLERDVFGTIAVRRRVLLLAEVPVAATSALVGRRIRQVAEVGRVRVIGLATARNPRYRWNPAPVTRIDPDDRLIVVATRRGLSQLLAESAATPPPPEPAAAPPPVPGRG